MLESRQPYQSLFEHSLDAILIIRPNADGTWVVLDCNQAACRMAGKTREALISDGVPIDRIWSLDGELLDDYAEKIRKGERNCFVGEYLRDDGIRILFEAVINAALVDGEERFLAIVRDIRKRRQVPFSVAGRNGHYNELLDLLPDFICEINSEFKVTYINRAGYVTLGYHEEDLKREINPFECLHPDDLKRAKANICAVFMGASYKGPNEYRFICGDGTERTFLINSVPRVRKGKICGVLCCMTDITERKRTEAALQESEEKYRALFESSPDAVLLVEIRDGGLFLPIVDCNMIACSMNGYSRDELIGEDIDLVNNKSTDPVERLYYLEYLRREKFMFWEEKHCHKDGHMFPVEVRAHYLVIGGKEYVLSIDRDISRQQQVLDALRESETKYRALFDRSMEGIILVDISDMNKWIIADCNEAFCNMNDYSREELVGAPLDILYTTKSILAQREEKLRILREETIYTSESVHQRKDGSEFPIETTSCLVTIDGKQYILDIDRDIGQRKKAEAELAAEKERLSVTLGSIGEGVIATDLEGCVVLINKAAEDLTGWTAQDAIGKPISAVFCTKNISSQTPAGPIFDLAEDIVLVAKDGTELIIEENGATIKDAQGNAAGMVIVFRDITRQRKNELELLKTQKLESLGILAGGIAHDFNNILTSVLLNIQLCKLMLAQRIDISRHLTDLEKAITRATNLTGQLLTFAKGGAPIKKRQYIADLIHDTVEFALRGSRSTYQFMIDSDLAPVEVDEGQLSQVINNLVINADQAMENGGLITVGAENIELKASDTLPLKPGTYIRIYVSDQGKGIPKEHLQKIFDPYFTTKQGGTV